jgi:hypothetical protein
VGATAIIGLLVWFHLGLSTSVADPDRTPAAVAT